MELYDAIRRRRMIRNYDDRPVDRETVERIVANALHAPSAGFSQGWGFLVLTSPAERARFWDIEWPVAERKGDHTGIVGAPVVVIPMSNKDVYLDRYAEPDKGWTDRSEDRWPVPFWDIDTGMASMLILLSAVNEGLGALFFGVRRAPEVRAAFGIPGEFKPIGAITIGHPAPDVPSPSLRRGRNLDAIRYERWS